MRRQESCASKVYGQLPEAARSITFIASEDLSGEEVQCVAAADINTPHPINPSKVQRGSSTRDGEWFRAMKIAAGLMAVLAWRAHEHERQIFRRRRA